MSSGVPSVQAPTFAALLWPARDSGAAAALRAVALVLAGSALLALSAKIQVPLPLVSISLQSLVVLLIGAFYGARLGAATVLLYLAEGALGLPVFQNTPPAVPGPLYFLGPTGGFLVGFVAAAAVTGALAERGWDRSFTSALLLMALGHLVLFAFGLAWLSVLFGPAKAWAVGAAPFLWATLLKTALAAALVRAAWTAVRRREIADRG
jgi:biotin transport system substrate-specific component